MWVLTNSLKIVNSVLNIDGFLLPPPDINKYPSEIKQIEIIRII